MSLISKVVWTIGELEHKKELIKRCGITGRYEQVMNNTMRCSAMRKRGKLEAAALAAIPPAINLSQEDLRLMCKQIGAHVDVKLEKVNLTIGGGIPATICNLIILHPHTCSSALCASTVESGLYNEEMMRRYEGYYDRSAYVQGDDEYKHQIHQLACTELVEAGDLGLFTATFDPRCLEFLGEVEERIAQLWDDSLEFYFELTYIAEPIPENPLVIAQYMTYTSSKLRFLLRMISTHSNEKIFVVFNRYLHLTITYILLEALGMQDGNVMLCFPEDVLRLGLTREVVIFMDITPVDLILQLAAIRTVRLGQEEDPRIYMTAMADSVDVALYRKDLREYKEQQQTVEEQMEKMRIA